MTEYRKIAGLLWARQISKPAWAQLNSGLYGTKSQGLAYEKKVSKAFPLAKRNLWFGFQDANGNGICSTDLVLDLGSEVLIIECKLTDTPKAVAQLQELYIPVVEKAWGHKARGVVIAKNLTSYTDQRRLVRNFSEAMQYSGPLVPLLHLPDPRWGHLLGQPKQG